MTDLAQRVRRRWLRLLLLVAALAAGLTGQFWLSIAFDPERSALAWAAAALLFVASYVLSGRERHFPGSGAGGVSRTMEWVGIGTVLAVGLFFVAYRIDEIPGGLNHDAAWEGLYALRILDGQPYTPYAAEAWGRETLTFYFRAASVWLLGPTLLAVQLPGMIAGFLMLPFFYGWLRSMCGARVGLIATLLLAAAGWHLVFSRTGWRSDFQPFFMAVTCFFFFRGMHRRQAVDFLLSGVALALTLNTYNAARVFPAVFGLWTIAAALQSWRFPVFVRRYGFGIGVMLVAFAVTIAPLAWYAYNNWVQFMGRANALFGLAPLGEALRASALLFNYKGNGDDFFVTEPGLELPTAVLFVFGLLWSLLRIRDVRAQFLLIGLIVGLVPGLVSKPNLNRDVGTMIFVFAFAGLGATYFAQQIRALFPRIGGGIAAGLLLIMASMAVVAGYQQYLSDSRRPIWGYYPETTVLGRYMRTLVPTHDIWVGGANFPRDTLTYLTYPGDGAPMRRRYTWVDDVRTLLHLPLDAPSPRGRAIILAAAGPGRDVLASLMQKFPRHELVDLRSPPETGPVFARLLLFEPRY